METLKHLTSRLKFLFYLCLMANNKLIKTLHNLTTEPLYLELVSGCWETIKQKKLYIPSDKLCIEL